MKNLTIYCIADEEGIPKYVGKTIKSLRLRIWQHRNDAKKHSYNMPIHSWIRKHPDFQVIILHQCPYFDDWEFLERHWISYLKSLGFKLLNATSGGDGNKDQKFSRETIEKRASKIRGVPRSPEVRRKISESHKGKIIPKSVRKKISETVKLNGHKDTYEERLAKSKLLFQYDKEGNFIRSYLGLWEAIKENPGYTKGGLSCMLTGRAKTYRGFVWKYAEEQTI